MKKYLIAVYAAAVLALVSCGGKSDTPAKPAAQASTTSQTSNQPFSVRFSIIGDNVKEVQFHSEKKRDAQRHLALVQDLVDRTTNMMQETYKMPSNSPQATASLKKIVDNINTLRQDNISYGDPIQSPLGKCSNIGAFAAEAITAIGIGMEKPTQSNQQKAERTVATFMQQRKECSDQIDNPPKDLIYALTDVPFSAGSTPFPGCAEILEVGGRKDGKQQWSCPASVAKK